MVITRNFEVNVNVNYLKTIKLYTLDTCSIMSDQRAESIITENAMFVIQVCVLFTEI